jgi:quinohemoprotein ethanol dehydrogenase
MRAAILLVLGVALPLAAAEPPSGEWRLHGRTHDEQRFSPLAAIDRSNVASLGLAWSYRTATTRGLEATPLMVDGVLYLTGSWSRVYALDARTGKELWTYDPEVPRAKGRDACCDVVNRGVAYHAGRIYLGALDGRLIALDAGTGTPVWSVLTVDPAWPYTITGAPRVVKGKVIIGNGGADLGVRGHFSAYDAETGALVWRFFTVPASKDGPHEHPELEAAAATWPADAAWETGLGGTVWDSFAFDPALDLLYAGVGNSALYDRERRSPGGGDNLYLASILALRPDTGELVWHYQTTPAESWDYTATQHMILADVELGGRLRQVLMQAPKNGFFYVLDRATGELLSAEPYVDVSWASRVDLATGRPVERPEALWHEEPAMVAPGPPGGHNWHPMAFHPGTGLVYVPSATNAYRYAPDPRFRFVRGQWNTGEDLGRVSEDLQDYVDAIPFCSPSHITAWDPVAARAVWRVDHDSPGPGGLLATAGGLVFQGTGSGIFAAYDARTGERLWETDAGIGIAAPPITYALGGEQYVAVLAGIGGSHGGHYLRFDYVNDGRLLVFKLGGAAAMPPVPRRAPAVVEAPTPTADAAEVARGRDLYARQCLFCHGLGVKSSGLYPDLRHAPRAAWESWNDIVLGGTRQAGGMPSFADRVTPDEAQAIRAYAIERAHHEPGWLEQAARLAGRYVCVPASWVVD